MKRQLFKDCSKLYAIVDYTLCYEQEITPLTFTKSFFNAGGDIIQYRNKVSTTYDVTKEIEILAEEARNYKKILIVNDYPEIAQKFGTLFHIGQEDFKKKSNPLMKFKKKKRNQYESMWGLSTHNIREVNIAIGNESDYIGFGSLFKSKTKEVLEPKIENISEILEKILKLWRKPIVLIGGISLNNIHLLPQEPRIFYAVIRDFFRYGNSSKGIEQYTKKVLSQLN